MPEVPPVTTAILFIKKSSLYERSAPKDASQSVEKILRRIFSFLCIRLYVIGKEDSNERNPSGVSFVFVQVSLAENEVFRQAEQAEHPTGALLIAIVFRKYYTYIINTCLFGKVGAQNEA